MDQYLLMNKDRVVAEVIHKEETFVLGTIYNSLPYGIRFNEGKKDIIINDWIENRKASKHNARLAQLMDQCGCGTTEGYLKFTHSATLNDTFWIKNSQEDVDWDRVSLYKNEFNEVVSKLAFEGGGLYGFAFSSTSPELTTNGSFSKCWKREEGSVFLYKRGRDDAGNTGMEPFCEVMASEVAQRICDNAVDYKLVSLHHKVASKCELFTSEEYGYIPYSMLTDRHSESIREIAKTLSTKGVDAEAFFKMVVLDALVLNTDRHLGNFGVLIDNDTQAIECFAPVFDLNLALAPYLSVDELVEFGRRSADFRPAIGDDFIVSAKEVLTTDIRAELVNLEGFKFSQRPVSKLSQERIEALEAIINTNIRAILGKSKKYLLDVYPEIRSKETVQREDEEKALSIADILMFDKGLAQEAEVVRLKDGEITLRVHKDNQNDYIVFRDRYRTCELYENDQPLESSKQDHKIKELEERYSDIIQEVTLLTKEGNE